MLHIKLLTGLLLLLSLSRTQAQTTTVDYTASDIFKGFMGWDVRFGGETHKVQQRSVSVINNQQNGYEDREYKNTRTTIDLFVVDATLGVAKIGRAKIGIPLGFNAGLSPQKKTYTYVGEGYIPNYGFPGRFGGDQGDLSTEKFTISMELKLGVSLAYNIIPAKNLQVSLGYNYRYWTKGNMGFYVLPKFLGGFFDANICYKKWHLATSFRSVKYELGGLTWGPVRVNYVSLLPTYNRALLNSNGKKVKGLKTIGLRIESTSAKSNNSTQIQNQRYEFKLNANSFLFGIYLGFLL